VSFPSLPGCVTFGKNLEHAQEMAQEVLNLWLLTLAELGKKIPVEKSQPKTYISKMKVALAKTSK
jgi:predicted RNase H-like HicB family nuclease